MRERGSTALPMFVMVPKLVLLCGGSGVVGVSEDKLRATVERQL